MKLTIQDIRTAIKVIETALEASEITNESAEETITYLKSLLPKRKKGK